MERIGFVGLGNMGKPMAENLARAGFPLTVLDLDPKPVADLVALGATAAASPRALAEASDIICSVVMNDRQTLDLYLDPETGILAGARPGSLIIIHSTVSLETCQILAEAAKAKGVHVIDAAVSGAVSASKAGTLTMIVGGDERDVDRARPLFEVVGDKIFHMGGLGMGQAGKICNNLMCLVNVHVALEGLRLAEAAGIDKETMVQLASVSSGQSWALQNLGQLEDLARSHMGREPDMSIFGRKDISLASKLGKAVESAVPITDFVFDRTKK
ncbi:MAG: NAD(P)-dependent oxidoreductase [Alphaproteobacteria bacterium]|nr:NAD(P)-dependent oxidoreductase [Alphaproteobacteria bacterium]MCB9927994.1 NAD(P)-dependent oxidoreductase [Alphaproteobacteria bacterium]